MRATFMSQPGGDAIYFQGALLDPIKVLDKMEADLNVPIVASNPAMLWFILSKLGLSYRIAGYGKLLSSLTLDRSLFDTGDFDEKGRENPCAD